MHEFKHAVIWIDHARARVIRFNDKLFEIRTVRPSGGTPHLHHRANTIDDGHHPEDPRYYHLVLKAAGDVPEILVAGPANAKNELIKHVERHDPEVRGRICAVQTVDHPTDREMLDHARRFFQKRDRIAVGAP